MRQDIARARRRGRDGLDARDAERRRGRRRRTFESRSSGEAQGARADDPLHRRGSPLQQGAAGCASGAARERCRDHDRRDGREPVLLSEQGAALARSGFRAAAPRGATRSASILDAGSRRRRTGGSANTASSCRRTRRSTTWSTTRWATPGRRCRRSNSRFCRRPRTERRHPDQGSTSATECLRSGSSATTATETRTTTWPRRSSRASRGSQPDAALHWMARMMAGGEDPRFIARRLVISASEDVGLADPRALAVAVAAARAVGDARDA